MDMQAFLQTVIPDAGVRFLVEILPTGKKAHHPFYDFADMAEKAAEISAAGGTVYHACSAFKEIKYNDFGYAVGRTKDNVLSVKALWQDMDVGKVKIDGTLKPDNYATKKDAVLAIKAMMDATGMPRPLLVDSGSGYHCYWPFEQAIPPDEWREIASLARVVMRHIGFKSDAARDTDEASILRPIDTTNKGTAVLLVRDQVPKSHHYYRELLTRYVERHSLVIPRSVATTVFENEFSGPAREFPPSSLSRVVEHCNQIRIFRDTGSESEPLWRLNLGVAKHCTDGEELAHEWSAKHPGYSEEETQGKLDRWMTGPATCDKFKAENEAGCTGCPHAGKVKSPVQLGYEEIPATPVISIPAEDETDPPEQKPIPHWPQGFFADADGLKIMVKDKDDVLQPERVASPLFYLTERIKGDDGAFCYTVRMNVRGGPNGEWREFELPAKLLADLRSMKMVLASREIVVHNDRFLGWYMNEYAATLRKQAEEINTFKQFGWNAERTAFLVGTSLVSAKGRTEVRVSDAVIRDPSVLPTGAVRGTKEEWSKGVETLYNREDGEPWQYTICTQFGAPLVPLLGFNGWNGIPLALSSEASGYGKSTVALIGMNALCNATKTMIADTTARAIVGRASVMNHLPLLVDEITRTLSDPKDLSDVVYSMSNGRPRVGMQSDGKERVPLPPYQLNSTFTSNKNLASLLAQVKNNPEAAQMRVFEIAMEDYPRMDSLMAHSTIHAEHHALSQYLVNNVHGVWANDYFRYVVTHMAEIKDKLHRTAMAIVSKLGGNSAKERFYAYHMACTLVGAWIAKKIGAIYFDLTNLKEWTFQHIYRMRAVASEYGESTEDQFSHMLASIHGSIIITKHFDLLDTKLNQIEVPMVPIRGEIQARLVLGSDKERGKLFVAVSAIDKWCAKQSVSASQFRRQLAASGVLRPVGDQGRGFDKKVSLGRGVPSAPMGRCRCVEVVYSVAQGYLDDHIQSGGFAGSNVTPIIAAQHDSSVNAEQTPTAATSTPSSQL